MKAKHGKKAMGKNKPQKQNLPNSGIKKAKEVISAKSPTALNDAFKTINAGSKNKKNQKDVLNVVSKITTEVTKSNGVQAANGGQGKGKGKGKNKKLNILNAAEQLKQEGGQVKINTVNPTQKNLVAASNRDKKLAGQTPQKKIAAKPKPIESRDSGDEDSAKKNIPKFGGTAAMGDNKKGKKNKLTEVPAEQSTPAKKQRVDTDQKQTAKAGKNVTKKQKRVAQALLKKIAPKEKGQKRKISLVHTLQKLLAAKDLEKMQQLLPTINVELEHLTTGTTITSKRKKRILRVMKKKIETGRLTVGGPPKVIEKETNKPKVPGGMLDETLSDDDDDDDEGEDELTAIKVRSPTKGTTQSKDASEEDSVGDSEEEVEEDEENQEDFLDGDAAEEEEEEDSDDAAEDEEESEEERPPKKVQVVQPMPKKVETKKPAATPKPIPAASPKPKPEADSSKKKRYVLFVGNLSYETSEEEIRAHFKKAGNIRDLRIAKRPDNKPRGFCHIEFHNEQEYQKALSMHHSVLHNRRINVMFSDGKKPNQSGPGDSPQKGNKKTDAKVKDMKLKAMMEKGMLAGSTKASNKRTARRKKAAAATATKKNE